ncbi:MAG: hypothetical protein LUF27_04020 [Lachnospiraceae bacterium]|nr:hypothetical protein [Lachnospiraceae bacterium]
MPDKMADGITEKLMSRKAKRGKLQVEHAQEKHPYANRSLPEWIRCSERSREFYRWLKKESLRPLNFGAYAIRPILRDGFCFLFLETHFHKSRKPDSRLAAVCDRETFRLSDVSNALRRLLQFPDDLVFESKLHARMKLEKEVNARLLYDMEHRQELFFALGRGIIPAVSRAEIHGRAMEMLEKGIPEEEIRYIPDIRFGREAGGFTWQRYLFYLRSPKEAADRLEQEWIMQFGEMIFQEKIRYSGIREDYRYTLERQKK